MMTSEGGNRIGEDEIELIAMERTREVRGIIDRGGCFRIEDEFEEFLDEYSSETAWWF
jgi:hypothetical protein